MYLLQRGSVGEDVRTAQAALNFYASDQCILLDPDSKFGNNTHNRTVEFQNEYGLKPDGIIGDETRKVLYACRTSYISCAVFRPPSLTPRPGVRFGAGPSGGGNKPGLIDWSKVNWKASPIWPPAPKPTNLWPPLNLNLPPFPGLQGLPKPNTPRLVLNAPLKQNSVITAPSPGPTPFDTPSVQLFLFKINVLSKKPNLKISSEIEPVKDDDGTSKVEGFVKSELDLLDYKGLSASIFLKAKAEGGLSPMAGKTTGSSGVKISLVKSKLDFGFDFKFLTVEAEEGAIKTKPWSVGGTVTAHW